MVRIYANYPTSSTTAFDKIIIMLAELFEWLSTTLKLNNNAKLTLRLIIIETILQDYTMLKSLIAIEMIIINYDMW